MLFSGKAGNVGEKALTLSAVVDPERSMDCVPFISSLTLWNKSTIHLIFLTGKEKCSVKVA